MASVAAWRTGCGAPVEGCPVSRWMIERPAAASALASRIMSMATKDAMVAGTGRPAWLVFDIGMKITYCPCVNRECDHYSEDRPFTNASRRALAFYSSLRNTIAATVAGLCFATPALAQDVPALFSDT